MHGIGTHFGHKLVGVLVVEVLVFLGKGFQNVQILVFREKRVEVFLVSFWHLCNAFVDHHIPLVVDDLVKLLGRDSEEVTNLVGEALEVPNVHHRHHQVDVAHALTTHLFLRDFYTATVAHNALVANALVLSAVAFVVLDWTKNALTKEAVTLRLVGTIVDRLRLQNLAM